MSKPKHNSVWVLTSECNDYDQHGQYFEALFAEKPDALKLTAYFKERGGTPACRNPMEALEFILHVLNGGGRMGDEHTWFHLFEVTPK